MFTIRFPFTRPSLIIVEVVIIFSTIFWAVPLFIRVLPVTNSGPTTGSMAISASAAIGESDEIVMKLTVSPDSPADGKTLEDLRLETETGMFALAVNRGGRWTYRPRDSYRLREGDSLLASGAPEGLEPFAELFGALEEIEELGE